MGISIEYVIRGDEASKPGGDLVQARKYADLLKMRGFDVTVSVGRPKGKGICHAFSVDRPVEFLRIARDCADRPFVVSAIHHSAQHVERFRRVRRGMLGLAERRLPVPAVEVVKDRLRILRGAEGSLYGDPLPWPSDRHVHDALVRASSVHVLADGEALWLQEDFGYCGDVLKVPNGIDRVRPVAGQRDLTDIDVVVVGRIEERKNQLALARTLSGSSFAGLRVVFLGRGNEVSKGYVRDFQNVVTNSKNLEWWGAVSQDEVQRTMLRSRISVSASFFEVLALGDLEAASAGCGVVASKNGNTEEFLGANACYVDPWRLEEDLQGALYKALERDVQVEDVLPTWSEIGDLLAADYKRIARR